MLRATLLRATLSLSLLSFGAAAPASAADGACSNPFADRAVFVYSTLLQSATLPQGPVDPLIDAALPLAELTELPDGRLVAIAGSQEEGWQLVAVADDFTTSPLGPIELNVTDVGGLAATEDGRLFLLYGSFWWNPPATDVYLAELDPADGDVLGEPIVVAPEIHAIARKPGGGLWAAFANSLRSLDPATGALGPVAVADLLGATDIDTDSSGRIWGFYDCVCSPPFRIIYRLDPASGVFDRDVVQAEHYLSDLAIRRGAPVEPDPTKLCLQDGRFEVGVSWTTAQGEAGVGRTTPARSKDSGIFYFFDPNNWELMVKVLDGCAINGYYWVFLGGTTNVGYELTVRDRLGDREKRYGNTVGELAMPVADTAAFVCP